MGWQGLLAGALAAGGIYALLALGLWLVWRYAGVANFAQGEVAAWAALAAWAAASRWGWLAGLLAAATLAAGLSLTLGWLAGGAGQEGLAVTFAAMLLLRGAASLLFGDQPWRWTGPWLRPVWAGLDVLTLATVLLAGLLTAVMGKWLRHSLTGVRLRAAAGQPRLAALAGVNVGRARRLAWLLAGLLAVPAGLAAGLSGLLEPGLAAGLALPAFTLVLLVPGLWPGALFPYALALGGAEQLLGRHAPAGARDLLLLAVLAGLVHGRARAAREESA